METPTEDATSRISQLEHALKLDDRLSRVEKRFGPTGGRGWIVGIVAILSAAIPVMQWLHGYMKTQRELAMAESTQTLSTQKDWLTMAVRQDLSPQEKQRVLRFLKTISSDGAIRKWAEQELDLVDAQVNELQAKLSQAERDKQAALEKIEAVKRDKDKSELTGGLRAKELTKDLEAAQNARRNAEQRAAELSDRLKMPSIGASVVEVVPLLHESQFRGMFGPDRYAKCLSSLSGWGWEEERGTPQQVCGDLLRGKPVTGTLGSYRIQRFNWDNSLYISLLRNGEKAPNGCRCSLDP
jgi:hypothetical protein